MPAPATDELLAGTRQLLREARLLIDGDSARPALRSGALGLYDALCRALDAIDGDRVHVLLGRIAEQVERLNELSADVERIRRLRDSIRAA